MSTFSTEKISDAGSGAFFTVVPGRGACLTEIFLRGQSVLDGYRSDAELASLDWGKSAILAPFPNRLKDGRYRFEGVEYQFPLNEPSRGNALHGFVMDKPFEVVERTPDLIALQYRYGGEFPWYPFPFALRVSYRLESPASFVVSFEMENTGDGAMPAGLGWHPYFRLGQSADEIILQLPAADRILVDERMIPTGEKVGFSAFGTPGLIGDTGFDTGFRLPASDGPAMVQLRHGSFVLEYWQDPVFSYLQVFIPPARRSIALEPMTCNIDAFRNGEGLVRLEPAQCLRGRAGVRLQAIPT